MIENINVRSVSSVSSMISRDTSLASLGEALGEFKPYDSQLDIVEITGTRILKLLYQVNAKTKTKIQENAYVRLPTKHLTEEVVKANIDVLAVHVVKFLQEVEDKTIRADHAKGLLSVYTESLGISNLIESLETSNEGTRLTKDKIAEWFDAEILESLSLLFMDKMGVEDIDAISKQDESKILTILAAYKDKFQHLANPRHVFEDTDKLALIGVIEKCGAQNSSLGGRFMQKLKEAPKETVGLELL